MYFIPRGNFYINDIFVSGDPEKSYRPPKFKKPKFQMDFENFFWGISIFDMAGPIEGPKWANFNYNTPTPKCFPRVWARFKKPRNLRTQQWAEIKPQKQDSLLAQPSRRVHAKNQLFKGHRKATKVDWKFFLENQLTIYWVTWDKNVINIKVAPWYKVHFIFLPKKIFLK